MDVDSIVRELTARQYGVVSRRQLREAAITRSAISHRVAKQVLIPVGQRVLTLAGAPEYGAKWAMVAVLDAPEGAFLSHRSAAAWWGLPGYDLNGRLEVTIPRRGAPKEVSTAWWHYQAPIPDHAVRRLKGIPVASPALVLMHLGAVVHPGRVKRTINNALARGLVDLSALRSFRKEMAGSGRNGVGVLAAILDEVGDDYVPTESGVELRVAEIAAQYGVGLQRQIWVGDRTERIGRADFRLSNEPRGLVEVLSLTYHGMFLDRLEDEQRFRRMERAGFEVLTIWDTDVWNRPAEVGAALVRFQIELASRRLQAK